VWAVFTNLGVHPGGKTGERLGSETAWRKHPKRSSLYHILAKRSFSELGIEMEISRGKGCRPPGPVLSCFFFFFTIARRLSAYPKATRTFPLLPRYPASTPQRTPRATRTRDHWPRSSLARVSRVTLLAFCRESGRAHTVTQLTVCFFRGGKLKTSLKRRRRTAATDKMGPSIAGRGKPRPLLAGVFRKACDYCVRWEQSCSQTIRSFDPAGRVVENNRKASRDVRFWNNTHVTNRSTHASSS